MIKNTHSARSPLFKRKAVNNAIKSVIFGAIVSSVAQTQAANWELDNGITIDLDTQVAYAGQWRMEEQDKTLQSPATNGLISLNRDGDSNFEDGDMTQNRFSISSDLDIAMDNDFFTGGVFLRARGFYDDVYAQDENANNPAYPFCNISLTVGSDCSDYGNYDGIDDFHKQRVELLDAFFYTNFDFGDQSGSFRAGSQVVSWGESLALYGGISAAQGSLDVAKAGVPGAELKDVFMPVGQVVVETTITDAISVGAYYQYDWERSRIDSPGTYLSAVDFLGEGVDTLHLGAAKIDVVRDEPEEGQWGLAVRYLAESLNNTEFGLYYLEYNDFLPTLQLTSLAGPLSLEYFEDISLVGASFGTVLGDTNVSGEVSFRDGAPVQISPVALGAMAFHYAPAQIMQMQVSALHIFGATAFADNIIFIGEIGYNEVLDIEETDFTKFVNGIGIGSVDVSDLKSTLDNDVSAAGYIVKLAADYYSITPGLDLNVNFTLKHDFDGTSSMLFTFTEDKMDMGIGADFTYLSSHRFGVKYVAYLTDPDQIIEDGKPLEFGHQLADRDYAAVYYKYAF